MSTKGLDIFTFVLMPFSSEFDDIYKLGIKETSKSCGVRAERLDEQLFGEGMLDRIYRQIDVADFVIADLSERNPNVFYELGYAHAKDKICILLTKDTADIPFDLKHKRHIHCPTQILHNFTQLLIIVLVRCPHTSRQKSHNSLYIWSCSSG